MIAIDINCLSWYQRYLVVTYANLWNVCLQTLSLNPESLRYFLQVNSITNAIGNSIYVQLNNAGCRQYSFALNSVMSLDITLLCVKIFSKYIALTVLFKIISLGEYFFRHASKHVRAWKHAYFIDLLLHCIYFFTAMLKLYLALIFLISRIRYKPNVDVW